MQATLLLLVFIAIISQADGLTCFVSLEGQTLELQKKYDYCVTSLNMWTLKIKHFGMNGSTEKIFKRYPNDLTTSFCYIKDETGSIDCYCKEDACNPEISVKDFIGVSVS